MVSNIRGQRWVITLGPYVLVVDGPTMRTGTLDERASSAAVLPNTALATPRPRVPTASKL